MFDKLKGAAGTVTSKAGSLKDMGMEAIQATVAELNATMPRLKEVGYSVTRVSLEIGLSPKIVLKLAKVFDVDSAAFTTILAANADKKTFCTILGALQKANQLQGKIQFQNRHFRELDIELGIPPAIHMIFLEADQPKPSILTELPAIMPVAETPPSPLPESEPEEPREQPETPDREEEPVEPPAAPEVESEEEEMEEMEEREEEQPPSEPEPEPEPEPTPAPPVEEPQWLRMWCEGCQRDYRVSADKAGLKARCRRCGTWIVVGSTTNRHDD